MIKQNPSGFIKIHRKILDWGWYSDTNVVRLFLHLILTSNYEEKEWRGVNIKRGQLITSLSSLALHTHLTVREVRTALEKLKSTNELTIKTTNKFTILELTNYGLYQDNKKQNDTQDDKESDIQETNKRQTNDKQTTTTKESKEGKKERNKEYLPLSEGLIFVLENKMNKKISENNKYYWADEIRKLIEIDLVERPTPFEDVQRAIQTISDNYGKEFFPVIQSGSSLREKFSKIEGYLQRSKPKSNLAWLN